MPLAVGHVSRGVRLTVEAVPTVGTDNATAECGLHREAHAIASTRRLMPLFALPEALVDNGRVAAS